MYFKGIRNQQAIIKHYPDNQHPSPIKCWDIAIG